MRGFLGGKKEVGRGEVEGKEKTTSGGGEEMQSFLFRILSLAPPLLLPSSPCAPCPPEGTGDRWTRGRSGVSGPGPTAPGLPSPFRERSASDQTRNPMPRLWVTSLCSFLTLAARQSLAVCVSQRGERKACNLEGQREENEGERFRSQTSLGKKWTAFFCPRPRPRKKKTISLFLHAPLPERRRRQPRRRGQGPHARGRDNVRR